MMAADMMNPPPNGSGSGSMSRKEAFEAQLRDLQQDISVLSVKLRPTAAAEAANVSVSGPAAAASGPSSSFYGEVSNVVTPPSYHCRRYHRHR